MEIDNTGVVHLGEEDVGHVDIQRTAVGEKTAEGRIEGIDRKGSAVGHGVEADSLNRNVEDAGVDHQSVKDGGRIDVDGLAVGQSSVECGTGSVQIEDAAIGDIAVKGQINRDLRIIACNSHGTGVGDLALEDGTGGAFVDPEITSTGIVDGVEVVDTVEIELTAVGGETVELVVVAVEFKLGGGAGVGNGTESIAVAGNDHIGNI